MHLGRKVVTALAASWLLLLVPIGAAAAVPEFDNRVGNPNYNYTCYSASQASPRNVCRTDNADLGWRMEGNIDFTGSANDTPLETSLNDTMRISYTGTDINPYFDTTPVYSGSGETDLVVRSKAGDFVTGDDGYTWCDDAAGATGNDCDQQYSNYRSLNTTRPLVCHETGHAVGLLHAANSTPDNLGNNNTIMECMMKNTVWDHRGLGPTNVYNINRMY